MTTAQWLLLWGALILFAGLLWTVLTLRVVRKARALRASLAPLVALTRDH